MPPTLADLDWPLHTERLLIRPRRVDDAEALYALRIRPEVGDDAAATDAELAG